MDFKIELIEELQEYDVLYVNATIDELKKGFEISKGIKEFDNPEDFLNESDLFLLSQYYAYRNIEDSKQELEYEYVFDDEDLDDEDL